MRCRTQPPAVRLSKQEGLNGKPYLQCDKTTQQYFEDLPLWEGTASLDTYSKAIFAVVEDVDRHQLARAHRQPRF